MSNENPPSQQPAPTQQAQKLPADYGLPGLGLSMQLAGGIFSVFIGATLLTMMMAPGGSREMFWMFLLAAAAVGRSAYHAAAGRHLLYNEQPLRMIPTYFVISAVQSALTFFVMSSKWHMPGADALGMAVGLMVWPTALLVISRQPRFANLSDRLPNTEDKSFEGLSIIMTMFGASGVLGMGGLLFTMLKLPSRELQQGPVMLLLLGCVLLFIRSVLHVRAGIRGVRETDQRSTVELINQYANFGIIAALVFGAVLFMLFVQTAGRRMPMLPVLSLVGSISWVLLLWPFAVRRYVSERQFTDLMADNTTHMRAVDGGLSVLGWFLLGNAALGLSMLAPELIGSGSGKGFAMFAANNGSSTWMAVLIVGLQIAAARELITMGPLRRTLGSVYGAVAVAVQLYNIGPMWKAFSNVGMRGLLDGGSTMMFTMVAVGLVIPVVTVLVVNRALTPTATARFRA